MFGSKKYTTKWGSTMHWRTIWNQIIISFGFLKHFARIVEVKKIKELESEFEARKNIPRIKMCTTMLVQASKMYTLVIFEAFQGEYERSMATCAKALDGNNCVISIGSLELGWNILGGAHSDQWSFEPKSFIYLWNFQRDRNIVWTCFESSRCDEYKGTANTQCVEVMD